MRAETGQKIKTALQALAKNKDFEFNPVLKHLN